MSGRFIVVDARNPRILAETRGADVVGTQVGSQVRIDGTAIPGAISTIEGVQVVGETALAKMAGPSKECSDAARAVNADAPPGAAEAGTKVKATSHTTAYVIGGVAVAGGAIGAITATRHSASGQ